MNLKIPLASKDHSHHSDDWIEFMFFWFYKQHLLCPVISQRDISNQTRRYLWEFYFWTAQTTSTKNVRIMGPVVKACIKLDVWFLHITWSSKNCEYCSIKILFSCSINKFGWHSTHNNNRLVSGWYDEEVSQLSMHTTFLAPWPNQNWRQLYIRISPISKCPL